METKQRKTAYGLTREQEREASRFFGRHVSPAKALCCGIAATLCCLSPMLLGLRLWAAIPEVVETGFITAEGRDDSLPRAVLVYGIPGLFAVLTLLCHGQLWLHQKLRRIPPQAVRLIGRWGMPIVAIPLVTFCLWRAAGETVTWQRLAPGLLALVLLLLGSHFFDCGRESKLAFRFPWIRYKEKAWRSTHRFAGGAWMAAGLLILAVWYGTGALRWPSLALTLLLLLSPLPVSRLMAKREE